MRYLPGSISEGKPQIEYSKQSCQWTARGDVLRCYIECSEESVRIPVIEIDGKRLSWREFGELVTVHEGWGMRVTFVPDDELHKPPCIDLRDSTEGYLDWLRLERLKPEGSC